MGTGKPMTYRTLAAAIASLDQQWLDKPVLTQDPRTGEFYGYAGLTAFDRSALDPTYGPKDPVRGQPLLEVSNKMWA